MSSAVFSYLGTFPEGILATYRMRRRSGVGIAVLVLSCLCAFQVTLPAQPRAAEEDQGITGFGLALRRLPRLSSVLYITAHPDDENNALLVRLGRGEGHRTGLLTLTRGDGGQNEIGPELFEAIGLLRSEELAAIHRFDHARQYYTRAFEFGFSYSVEETFQKWGRQEILADIVRVIREFRPTIILSLNPGGAGGGQHHQASAQLAAEAFRLAGNPSIFPEQINAGLRPWQPLRLFQAARVGMGVGGSGPADVSVELGVYDPLLGETYGEYGARARANHRSQGMNVLPRPGPMSTAWTLAGSTVPSSRLGDSFFTGIETDLQQLVNLDTSLESSVILLQSYVDGAREAFDRGDYSTSVEAVMTGLDFVRKLSRSTSSDEALFLLQEKEQDFLYAAERGHFVHFDALTEKTRDGLVVAGESLEVVVQFISRADVEAEVTSVTIDSPDGWLVEPRGSNSPEWSFRITVPEEARLSKPYWYREDPSVDRFSVEPGYTGTEPFPDPPLVARVQYRSSGVTAELERPVKYRWFAADYGQEMRRELSVISRLSVSLSPQTGVIRVEAPERKSFKVRVRNNHPGPSSATVRLEAPRGWTATPASYSVEFREENEVQTRSFELRPPDGVKAGSYSVKAVAASDGREYDSTLREIAYSHIQPRLMMPPSTAQVEVMDVTLPTTLSIGYIRGVGDEVGEATEQLGAQVTYLTEDDLTGGDLRRFDAIVTGVRAYLARPDLVANNHRLLEYVRQGGHLLVQYNKYEFLQQQFGPYPASINRPHDRVTVEESPVRMLDPSHAAFHFPNRITDEDFEGWVQERGLYFLGEWDDRYQPLLELQDPWPYNHDPKRGALVFARYGEGTYIYTGLAFFRQLPAGVVGAYRLWANLLSLGAGER